MTPQDASAAQRTPDRASRTVRVIRWALLLVAASFFGLHFLHLRADFPNDAPWMDWSKYTDEGWYGDAAIRHFLLGHWYLPGDFNPAVALPVWPLLLGALFHFTGVSLVAARALAVAVFGVMLLALYALLQRFGARQRDAEPSLAGPLALLFLSLSPFFFAFDRLAILEPLVAALTVLALLVAASLQPWEGRPLSWAGRLKGAGLAVALGLLLPAMVLTKTTAVALFPAIAYMVWHRAGYRLRPALLLALPSAAIAALLWTAYLLLLVRPHYMEDYRYLFSANAYTGFQLQPLATVLFSTFSDGYWMGTVLYPTFFVGLVLTFFGRPAFIRNPLVVSLLLWIAGYFVFLAYHNNLQPRYYLVPAVPLTALVALMLEEFRQAPGGVPGSRVTWALRTGVVVAVSAAIAIPDGLLQLSFLRHPEYTFVDAAQGIARIVRANPAQSPWVLSISGSDLSLITGLPSIDDDFGTLDLDQRVRQYRPGWYAAWNQIEDDKMDALSPLFHPVRVASLAAMDDPDRNQLILYRLDPAQAPGLLRRRRLHTPKPLRTKLGQQPTTTQLQH